MPRALKGIKSKAFSLTELLITLAAVSCLAGALLLGVGDTVDASAQIRREADDFAFWLMDRMALARTEEANLRIISVPSPAGGRNAALNVQWLGGARSGKTERYRSDKVNIFPAGGEYQGTYSGTWGTLTPAATFSVKAVPPARGTTLYVVVSGQGLVTVRENK